MITVENLTTAEQYLAVNVIVRAFSADPAARWLYPDAADYQQYFGRFVRAFAGGAFAYGRVDCVGGDYGAALWLAPGAPTDEAALFSLLQESLDDSRRDEAFALIDEMERCHPSEPHWYLPMIGVDPAKQGCGYGSALLAHALRRCDRDRKSAYLEASSPKSMMLYERHGFERLGTIQVGSSPPLFPMLRTPRRQQPEQQIDSLMRNQMLEGWRSPTAR